MVRMPAYPEPLSWAAVAEAWRFDVSAVAVIVVLGVGYRWCAVLARWRRTSRIGPALVLRRRPGAVGAGLDEHDRRLHPRVVLGTGPAGGASAARYPVLHRRR